MSDTTFLPDFCETRMVFAVIVVGELLAFLLVLTPVGGAGERWQALALISLFIQAVALSSMSLLCVAKRAMRGLHNNLVGVLSYGVVLVLTVVFSEIVYHLVRSGLIDVRLSSARDYSGQAIWFAQSQVSSEALSLWHREFVLRNLGIGAIVAAVALRYFYVQYQWRANLESEAQSRIQALQSRIRPHFLFNSMNTIAAFTRSKPELAEQVVEDLADLFRVSLGDARVPVTLKREFEVCREYLRIEGLRLGERLSVQWAVDDLPEHALLPALCLQPLLENAIYHGIEPAPEGGRITIEGSLDGEQVRVEIKNTVCDANTSTHQGNQMAQDNVRQRLSAFFGAAGDMQVAVTAEEYCVAVQFPVRKEAL